MPPDLPEELLQQIFANFQVPGPVENVLEHRLNRQTLTAVCRASKQCCRLAQPILFHTVHLGAYMQISVRSFWELSVQKPQLASLVRSLHIEDWEYPREELDINAHDVTTEVNQSLQEATKDAMKPLRRVLGMAYETALSHQLAGIEDGMLVYLIARCENLTCLELMVPLLFSELTCVYLALKSMALCSVKDASSAKSQQRVRALPHLKELRMHHWDTENAFRISQAIPFWTFSTLQIFRGNMVTCSREYGLRDAPDVNETNIRTLDLYQAIIEADVLRVLLRHFPKLEVLSIVWGSACVGDCVINHEHIGQVLRDHPKISKNLKKLVLNPLDAFNYEDSDEDFHAPLGSLKSFESLEHLGLDPKGLIGEDDEDEDDYPNFESLALTEMLPGSLQTLDVLSFGYEYSGDALDRMMSEMMPLDTQLYALMSDDRFSKLSTIKMSRGINEGKITPKDVGWKQVVLKRTLYGQKEFILSRDVEQSADP